MSIIRAVRNEDAEKIGTLFCDIFLNGSDKNKEAVIDILHDLYLPSGHFADADCPSLVAHSQKDENDIVGFIGVYTVPMQYQGKKLKAAICGSLMTSPQKSDPMTAPKLLKRFVSGPQDLSVSETASEVSAAMWSKLRGQTLPNYSMEWYRTLRPTNFALNIIRQKIPIFAIIRPLADFFDWLICKCIAKKSLSWLSVNPSALQSSKSILVEANRAQFQDAFERLSQQATIYPDFSKRQLTTILQSAESKNLYGQAGYLILKSKNDQLLGACFFHYKKGEIMHILHLIARTGAQEMMLDAIINYAARNRAIALQGRICPQFLNVMLPRRLLFTHLAATVIHSTDIRIIDVFRQGNAIVNGLVGERWNPLNGNDFK